MCGIAGIINFNGQPVEKADLKLMTEAIKHRGPDGEGFYVQENVGFGHRRLAIIDLSEAGSQPMTRFGCTITYNGEIYNYLEIRQELEKKGISFSSKTDTEVILAAYHVWGTECVNRFNGMWSFAIHDTGQQKVFFSRDRFGEKPFYYFQSGTQFIFCSEIKGLLKVIPTPLPNSENVARFLVFEQSETFDTTFFEGIKKLPAGHHLVLNLPRGELSFSKYYLPVQTSTWRGYTKDDLKDCLLEKLNNSIQIRMRSDVEVGACLSGGLDSSAITALATRLYSPSNQNRFVSVTGGSLIPSKDEKLLAQEVANYCGASWHSVSPTLDELQEIEQTLLEAQEEPFATSSVYLQHVVMQKANKLGLKVMLDGQGADELLLGYHQHLAWAMKSLSLPAAIKLGIQATTNYELSYSQIIKLYFYHGNPQWKKRYQLKRWSLLKPMLKEAFKREIGNEVSEPQDIFSLQVNDLYHRILPGLLRYEDKNAMAYSIETRLPFLDVELVSFLLNVPIHEKIQDGWSKHLLRDSMDGFLPEQIIWRKGKIGFELGEILPNVGGSPLFKNFLKDEVFQSESMRDAKLSGRSKNRISNLAKWFGVFYK